MSTLITWNGSNFIMPQNNEVGWGSNLTSFFVALPAGALQKTGGSFTLSAETDFGGAYGLKSLYYKSKTANPASAGQLRLASTDLINFRNNANGADISLEKDTSDNLKWNTKKLLLSGDVVNADINAAAAIAYSKLALTGAIVNTDVSGSAAIAYSKLTLSGSIVNADVSASAAIAYSKLALTNTIVNADIGTAAAIAYSKLALTGTIVNADIGASAAIARSKVATGTAYTLLANSSTGALSEVSGVGSSGQVLTSNGAGFLPTFQNVAGTGTVNSGTATQLAYYATSTNAVSGNSNITVSSGGKLTGPAGSSSSPTYTFAGGTIGMYGTSPTLGFAVPTAGDFEFRINGTEVFDVSAGVSKIYMGLQVQSIGTGTVVTPDYSFLNDTGSGLCKTGLHIIALATNGVKAVEIDASQNVTVTGSINTVTPTEMGYVHGITSSVQTQLDSKAALAGATFVGAVDVQAQLKGKGTATNDSAAAGYIGEVIESVNSSGSAFPTSTQYGDLTSIALTAGDWLISALVELRNDASGTSTQFTTGISATTGNSGTGLIDGSNVLVSNGSFGNDSNQSLSIPSYHVQLASPTTYYLKYRATWATFAPVGRGRITAVRIR